MLAFLLYGEFVKNSNVSLVQLKGQPDHICVMISELESDSDICSYEDSDGYKGINYF